MSAAKLWLAPLRGVTIRAFREAFRAPLAEAGFCGAFAPFIPANPGIRVNARMLAEIAPPPADGFELVPQVITRHPDAMRVLLRAFREAGFRRADLNAGCPFPMIRKRGRGSGLLENPDLLEELLAAGCEEMGTGNFSVKTRLGVRSADELIGLMPRFNRYPLAALTVHARTARQMYDGAVDRARLAEIVAASANPVICNGDLRAGDDSPSGQLMVGRSFVRGLGARGDAVELLAGYLELSQRELSGDRPVLGRMKELLAYWAEESAVWRRRWDAVKICRSVEELKLVALRAAD